jgi:hypothetical protein
MGKYGEREKSLLLPISLIVALVFGIAAAGIYFAGSNTAASSSISSGMHAQLSGSANIA